MPVLIRTSRAFLTRRNTNAFVRVLLVYLLSASCLPSPHRVLLIYQVKEWLNCSMLDTDTGGGKYDSSQGRQLCRKILAEYVPYDPTTPTGSGKTGYLILLMLVVRK